jgi:hypothetical protein
MRTIFGLLAVLMLVLPALGDDAAVATGGEGYAASGAWVVVDDDIYFCRLWDGRDGEVLCKKARME